MPWNKAHQSNWTLSNINLSQHLLFVSLVSLPLSRFRIQRIFNPWKEHGNYENSPAQTMLLAQWIDQPALRPRNYLIAKINRLQFLQSWFCSNTLPFMRIYVFSILPVWDFFWLFLWYWEERFRVSYRSSTCKNVLWINLCPGPILKLFLEFRKFQSQYSHEVYSWQKV